MEPWREAGTWALGVTFLVLGVAGLVLPILQGILFLLVGLAILSRVSDRASAILAWAKERAPDKAVRKSEELQERWTRKLRGEDA
jgi:uncharacterized membrane protein YbaN (DUF454 family)